jgi:hypothetical protein
MNKDSIKRRYYYLRQGGITVAPAMQMSNFLMLSYLTINEIIPIWIFAPLFIVSITILFTYIGKQFRKHQTPTDVNLVYEKSTEAAETVVHLMEMQVETLRALGKEPSEQFLKRLEYMRKIMRSEL